MHVIGKGGAFLLPPGEHHLKFLAHVRTKLGDRDINVSVALLEYSEHLDTQHFQYENP
jgi:hypothetical protein